MKQKNHKMLWEILLLIALMGITFYFILRGKDVKAILESVLSVRKRWLIPAVLSMLLYIFCGGWCIRVMLHGLGQKMSIFRCFKYSFIEFYFSAITPSSTGGQPMQLVQMSKDGYNVSDSSVVLLAITALYKLSSLLLSLVLFLFNAAYMSRVIEETQFLFILGLILNVGLILILCLLLFSKRLIHFLIGIGVHLLAILRIIKEPARKLQKIEEKMVPYHNCAKFIRSHRMIMVRTFLVLALQRLAIISVPYFIYRSFGLNFFTYFQIISTQLLLGICVEMLPFPGAVGISETVFLILFQPIFTEAYLYSAVLLSRGISFYLMLLLSGLVVVSLHFFNVLSGSKGA